MRSMTPAPPARDDSAVPIFELYGYGNVWTVPDPMFCETVAAQRTLHNWHVLRHKHADLFQVLFLESGRVAATIDGRLGAFGPGSVLLVPRMVVHEFAFQPGTRAYILSLTYPLLYQICRRFDLGLCAMDASAGLKLGDGEGDAFVAMSFERLDHEYRTLSGAQRGPVLEMLLSVILSWIGRRVKDPRGHGRAAPVGSMYLERYTRLINDHYRDQHQVDWYAQRVGVTRAHLNVIVRTAVGKSASRLIHERLLLEARRELIYTTHTIRTIADALGFSEPGYFTRFFTREAGVSPRGYRRTAHPAIDGDPARPASRPDACRTCRAPASR